MENCETDLLFPVRVIPSLISSRGEIWQSLVQEIISTQPDSLETIAFTLLMVRISNCIFCNTDSYRAMHGCNQCARQALNRFRGTDQDLIELFETAKSEVKEYLEKRKNGKNHG
jgi:hypothetical protein